jgi:predicted permease
MMSNVPVQTVVPILLLIAAGFLSRKIGILRSGDERVLSSYVYYFALPALSIVNLSEIVFTSNTLKFMSAGILPIFIAVTIFVAISRIFRVTRDTLYLLIMSTVFGSVAFFGLPFITFAFPTTEGEHLAVLSVSSIGPIGVAISMTTLELYRLGTTTIWEGLKRVLKKFLKNPLILSILTGFLLAILRVEIPLPLSTSLHMLGKTTSAVAIFMLGVFLYGPKYTNIRDALKLSLLRILFLPVVALLTTEFLDLPTLERTILVLMHSTPIAVSIIVLSERYNFYKEIIASLILVSTILGGLCVTLWLLLLGTH